MSTSFSEFLHQAYFIPLSRKIPFIVIFIFLFIVLTHIPSLRLLFNRFFAIKRTYLLTVLFALALGIRTIWCFIAPTQFPTTYHSDPIIIDESALINILSVQISQGSLPKTEDNLLSTRRPIGYPYLLGALYKLFGYHDSLFKVVQVIFGTLLVVVSYFLGLSIFQNDKIAVVASLLMAVYPENIIAANIVLDEFPFFLTLFLALYLTSENIRKKSVSHTFRIGALLGLATLFRTHAFFMPFIFFIAYLVSGIKIGKAVVQMFFSFFIILLMSSPWAWITYKHFGKPCFSTTYGSIAFYGTLNDRASWHNGYLPKTVEDGGDPEFLKETNPVKAAAIARKLAFRWVLKNPGKFVKLFLMRNTVLYGFDQADEILDLNETHAASRDSFAVQNTHSIRKIRAWSYCFIAILPLFGCAVMWVSKNTKYPATIVLFLIFLYWCGIHGFFFGSIRKYRWLIDLIFIFPTSFFLCWLGHRSYGARQTTTDVQIQ